jgi:hypothetical protein
MSANANFDAVKTFFDPHSGFAETTIPIPSAVKKVAYELDGKQMVLREAVAKIRAVTRVMGVVLVKNNEDGSGWITIQFRAPHGINRGFRVIRFK